MKKTKNCQKYRNQHRRLKITISQQSRKSRVKKMVEQLNDRLITNTFSRINEYQNIENKYQDSD